MLTQFNSALSQYKSSNAVMTGFVVTVAYLALVRYRRYKLLDKIRQEYPDPDMILKDNDAAHRVLNITSRKEFPFLSRQSMEFAIFKTFAVPSISKLLVATKEFSDNTRKRAEDTEIIVAEILDPAARIENEYQRNPNLSAQDIDHQKQRHHDALQRLNEIHGNYRISNDDYLYTLLLFIIEPVRWINRYEWRQLDQREINAIFRVWYDIGVEMKIKDIPETFEKMLAFKEKFELERVRYSPSNWKCAEPTMSHVLTRVPCLFWPLFYKAFPSVLDPHDNEAFGIGPASPWISRLISAALGIRAFVIRHAFLPRRKFVITTIFEAHADGRYKRINSHYETVYPNGYFISELGPQKFCPVLHVTPHQ